MKFGNYLKEHMQNPWRLEYIQYDLLKMNLKNRQLDHEWNQEDENVFVQLFSNEKVKVIQFIHNFNQQLISRIKYSAHLLQNAQQRTPAAKHQHSPSFSQLSPMNDSTARFLNMLDDTLVEILFDIHGLSTFIQLNHLGFEKILKKHKKWTHIDHHHPSHASKYRHDIASLQINNNRLLYQQVSELRYKCRRETYSAFCFSYGPRGIASVVPERNSRKFWIHPDHISEVTAILCMYSYIVQKPDNSKDTAMSNLYFDNERMDAYSARVKGEEINQAIKCKRYGSFSNKPVYYFEDQAHNSLYSSKIRFKVDKDRIADFCQEKRLVPQNNDLAEDIMNMDEKEAIKLVGEDSLGAFAKATHNSIHARALKPILQCNYNRLTFQLPNNENNLMITLDTNIEFHEQHSTQGFTDPNNKATNTQHKKVFQYAVLEVKHSTTVKMDDSSLHWINVFTQKSKLVHEVLGFSKYVQGVYQMFADQENMVSNLNKPIWVNFYERGVRTSIQYEGLSRSRSLSPLLNGKKFRLIIPYSNPSSVMDVTITCLQKRSHSSTKHASLSQNMPVVEAGDELVHTAAIMQNETPKIALGMNEKIEMHSRTMDNSTKSFSSCSRYGNWNSSPSSNSNYSNNNSAGNLILDQDGRPVLHEIQFQSQFYNKSSKIKGHDIELGVIQTEKNNRNNNDSSNKKTRLSKIEPKVFFANERTFISWLQFCALLLTVALSLLNFGDKISRVCGGVFLFVSMLLALYALARFQYRAWQLRTANENNRFDDIYGPAALCILIVTALIINFYLRVRHLPDADNKGSFLHSASS